MALLRFIFSIIFSPIRWFANLLTQHKDNLLKWHLNYGPFVKIQMIHKGQSLADDLLIVSYILFLSRYFYICDERQTNVVRDFLLNAVRKSQEPGPMMTTELYEIVFTTLNPMEHNAVVKLFEIWNKLTGLPPLTYSEDEEPKYSFAKYRFLVFERAGGRGLASIFHMSAGPDIILLPLTVAILYDYVVNKIRDKDKKIKLDASIVDLLVRHESTDCRSIAGLSELPMAVINNNNLIYWN